VTVHSIPSTDAEARDVIARALDDTIIVEAAAGTGKTTALVGRIVAILAEGRARVDEIVAVTFTEKAAGELKLRLRERLDRARVDASDPARSRLDDALKGLEEAHVSTIHGFCADILRERPVEAGVDPLFEVLTEAGSARLFDEAFGRWLQEVLANPGEGVRRALRRSASGGADGPVDRLRKAAWELTQWRDFTGAWTRQPFDRRAEIDSIIEELHELATLSRQASSKTDPLLAGTEPARRLSEEILLQRSPGEPEGDADYDGWEAALVDLSRERVFVRAKTGRGASYGNGIPRERVVQARTALQSRLEQFRMMADADLAALLQQELRGAIERYDELKAHEGALDFLDLLLGARNLVRGNEQVRRDFQKRFKRIFVDEFQDTDPLQAEILLLLSAGDERETDWRSVRPRPGALFLVGDPKQSIYRFRRADVSVYRDVCGRLAETGARPVRLSVSFRGVPEIQACVNAAFGPVMTGDPVTLQAPHVPLAPHRPAIPGQPAVVALPVPAPYKWQYVSPAAVEESMPAAVGAFVDWLVHQSGWRVTERTGEAPVPVAAKHVCLLFRRFISWQSDVTRPYVEALEARGVPHVLVGGRAFHEREEVEAIRAALAAIEWPDDELSVFATLRGPFFAVGDEALLEWTHRFGTASGSSVRRFPFHPFRVPRVFDAEAPADVEHLRPIANALGLLRQLHRRRNYVPVAETLHTLLGATRAHVGFALQRGGEQALANALHVAELARQFEAGGGISFRAFVDELRVAAETAQAAEAPILEEDSDGVRMMTVHKAKGLEFPVVILADLTCKLSRADAGRWIDQERNVCALKLAGWSPSDLLLHDAEESARDRAEGERLAYVAATRARDLLVIPAIGDERYDGSWLDPLMPAIYPDMDKRRHPLPAEGCPAFPSKDTVLARPDGDPARPGTVAPGGFTFGSGTGESGDEADRYGVVWWDPHALILDAPAPGGLRRDDLIAKDGDPAGVERRMGEYRAWQADRAAATARARVPSVVVRTATAIAQQRESPLSGTADAPRVRVVEMARPAGRPYGPRFGTLVHATLATVDLDADPDTVRRTAETQARILLASEVEIEAAAEAVSSILADSLFDRVRAAAARGLCSRECPILWRAHDGSLVEGTVDVVFEEDGALTILDFKTDRGPAEMKAEYERQLGLYCRAFAALRKRPVEGILVRV
jgi:ATP-dependent exoDNAse (exonuclease V) beta subunit